MMRGSAVRAAPLAAQPGERFVPRSIEDLRGRQVRTSLEVIRALEEPPSFTAELVQDRSGTLIVYATVATPKSSPPARGFPVLIANRGTDPDPPRYGIGARDTTARPGDYYRPVPQLYSPASSSCTSRTTAASLTC
jgi:hypothetical protein